MLFCNGRFEGLYYKEELDLFIEKGGRILEIKYAFLFKGKNKPIFKEFADNFINLRENSNSII
jgi:hypothetical protein